jgi:hypothetical protein
MDLRDAVAVLQFSCEVEAEKTHKSDKADIQDAS